MNVKDAIKTIRVMLGSDVADTPVVEETVEMAEETTEVVEHNHAEAILVDDTVVYTEGELAEGATLFVQGPEGEDAIAAPAGQHMTKDGLLITVAEGGVIEAIETVEDEPVMEDAAEEKVEEDMTEEKTEEDFDANELLGAIADMIKDYKEYVDGVKEEMTSMKEEFDTIQERFNAVADLPATKPVKKDYLAEAKAAKEAELSRFEKLAAMRKK